MAVATIAVLSFAGCSSDSSDDESSGVTTLDPAAGTGSNTNGTADTDSPSNTAADATTAPIYLVEFTGEILEVTERGGRVIKNFGELEVIDGFLVGSIGFAAEGQFGNEEGVDGIGTLACIQIELDLDNDDVEIPDGGGTVEVSLQHFNDLMYRACPPGAATDRTPIEVSLEFAEDGSFTGALEVNDLTVGLSGAPE